ncbi:MAG TPA: hypothetical protein PKA63_13755 [Oligoflexia bacterium]|nr:hypothetical protein [Oligoflexia bacterium]HMP49728.1 hypothetical protein [Oligoflexia bacterium]
MIYANDKLSALRSKHPYIEFVSYSWSFHNNGISIEYRFVLDPGIVFKPTLNISVTNLPIKKDSPEYFKLDKLVFLLGMVELISYWKLACPSQIIVSCFSLDQYECNWWKSLFVKGLGEFFFVNDLSPSIDFEIKSKTNNFSEKLSNLNSDLLNENLPVIVMVGGGKDSCVGIEVLKSVYPSERLIPLCLNPIPASYSVLNAANIAPPIIVSRIISPLLVEMSKSRSYFNGHTPFSALLSFVGVISAILSGAGSVVSSNEASASEGNLIYQGLEVNHQYSKSLDYEESFREYLNYIGVRIDYYSVLRPLNEIQIAGLFSNYREYFKSFQSCNRMQTLHARKSLYEPKWCGSCSKCVFTFIVLAVFLGNDELKEIFGELLVLNSDNMDFLKELLARDGKIKPFECVGTEDEVRLGLGSFLARFPEKDLPHLRNLLLDEGSVCTVVTGNFDMKKERSKMLEFWNDNNFLPDNVLSLVREKISILA